VASLQNPRDFKPTHSGEIEIQQYDIRDEHVREPDALLTIGRFPDDFQIRLFFKAPSYPSSKEWMVVN
jgi:hypothetical protein